jgi:hypothetical protein
VVAAHCKGAPLNCRTGSSGISGYRADFHEGHDTVGTGHGRGVLFVNRPLPVIILEDEEDDLLIYCMSEGAKDIF